MSTVVWRTEAEGLPLGAEGFVVSRDGTGRGYGWTSVSRYRKPSAALQVISVTNMNVAIAAAGAETDRLSLTLLYVMWG
jgi:hypothetical protein